MKIQRGDVLKARNLAGTQPAVQYASLAPWRGFKRFLSLKVWTTDHRMRKPTFSNR
jgi:hypothetical protein